jgi:hypothetical protein
MNIPGLRFRPAHATTALWLAATTVVLLASCAESTPPLSGCEYGLSKCGDACVDLNEDEGNCGACGEACASGETCRAGGCEQGEGGTGGGGGEQGGGGEGGGGCRASETDCSGSCADLQTDEGHCGACDVACHEGQTCTSGECLCPAGLDDCGDSCANLQSDGQHCGNCETSCSPTQTCSAGVCSCTAGLTDCNGTCTDLASSPQHCGTCEVQCSAGAFCRDGECSCVTAPYEDLGSTFPQTLTGTTADGAASYGLSCLAAGSTEYVYLFSAVEAGTYTFDTFGSGFDTVLGALRAESCVELACNDDSQVDVAQSKIRVVLDAGETALVVVTGFNGAAGSYVLHVSQAAAPVCPSDNIDGPLPQTVTGDTTPLGDYFPAPSCGNLGSPDASYTFTAPATGRYVFDTAGSSYNTVLELHDGGCDGPVISCNDDSLGPQSRLTVDLAAGQTVLAVVDGFSGASGPFTLNVSEWEPPPCPRVDLGSTIPQTYSGNSAGLDDVIAPPCGFSGGGGPEVTHGFTAPADGRYTFDAFGTGFSSILYMYDGTCTGPLLVCDESGSGSITMPLSAGQSVIVVLDALFGDSGGAYTLNVSGVIAPPCPSVDLGSTVPQTVTGTTTGLGDFVGAPCGPSGGAEATYSFTAPTDGVYVFDTFTSSFNTVLHVHDGTCGGPSLGCNDNTPTPGAALQSRVTTPLSAGQTVVVVVDGSGSNAGNYTLNVSQFTGAGTCANIIDLGSTVPQTVTGSTLLQPSSGTPSCFPASGNDLVYRFTAPAAGAYVIDTVGSTFDTVLHVHGGESCADPELACNDNTAGITSRVNVMLTAGQVITIVADSHSAASGNLRLNINAAAP